MFKILKNLLPAESVEESDSNAIAKPDSIAQPWSTQIERADALWQEGKLSEALAIYDSIIEANPNVLEIQQRLAGRLKQQGNLATAYEKLATDLKNQGNIPEAANYYREAIALKALTGNTKEQLLRRSVSKDKSPIPIANLKEAAFSFQPLANPNSTLIKVPPTKESQPNVEVELNTSPSFPRLKAINPSQAKDIDWETAQVYLQKALDHLEAKEWQQSALACKQATKILPDLAEAYKIWGNALQRMGKTADAMTCYGKAVEIKPNLGEVYAGIADIYAQQGKWQQAIKHYQKAIIIKPSAKVYRNLADIWQQLGDTERSQLNTYKAVELESSQKTTTKTTGNSISAMQSESVRSIEAYCRTARQLEQENKWQQATLCYRKALDISMTLPALLPSTAMQKTTIESDLEQKPTKSVNTQDTKTQSSESQIDKAIKRYLKQSKLQPDSPKIYVDLGSLYAKKAKWRYAIACYRKAINLKPSYAKAHLNLARVLLKVGRQQEFVQEMQTAFNLQSQIGSALDRFYLGNALSDRGQERQAISFYYKAIVLDPKFVQAYHRMGELLSKQGKHQQAIEFLSQAIEHNPDDTESYYFLGLQHESLQNWDNAVKVYSKVLQLEPQFPSASQKLNHALAQKLKNNKSKS